MLRSVHRNRCRHIVRGSPPTNDADADTRARADGAQLISAYEMHPIGIDAVLDRIPDGGPYYLTIAADDLDPTIIPAVNAPTPGGHNWIQIRKLIHGLVNKGRVLGMELVEILPAFENGNLSLLNVERLIYVHWRNGSCGILRLMLFAS